MVEFVIIVCAFLAFGALVCFVALLAGESRERGRTVEFLRRERNSIQDDYHNFLHTLVAEKETERKLWANSAIVRGGGSRIFKDEQRSNMFTLAHDLADSSLMADAEKNAKNKPLEFDVKPPFAAAVSQWKAEDSKRNSAPVITPELKNDLIDGIENLKAQ